MSSTRHGFSVETLEAIAFGHGHKPEEREQAIRALHAMDRLRVLIGDQRSGELERALEKFRETLRLHTAVGDTGASSGAIPATPTPPKRQRFASTDESACPVCKVEYEFDTGGGFGWYTANCDCKSK